MQARADVFFEGMAVLLTNAWNCFYHARSGQLSATKGGAYYVLAAADIICCSIRSMTGLLGSARHCHHPGSICVSHAAPVPWGAAF